MPASRPQHLPDFGAALRGGERLLGTFVKIATSHVAEIVGDIGYDFVVIDAEHAPLDRAQVDYLILAARAAGLAPLVRLQDGSAASVLTALDSGAAGILVPHIDSAAKAREVAQACRYIGGTRGFSNTTRAGRYGGFGMPQLAADQDGRVLFVAMLEDAAALDRLDDIAGVDGLDAIFIGRADLTVALGQTDLAGEATQRAVEQIAAAARRHGRPLMVTAANGADARKFQALGASAFVLGADVSFIRRSAAAAFAECAEAVGRGADQARKG